MALLSSAMISIIIPTLNEECALPATLKHVFAQNGVFEVIVVDGGSTDNTINIVTSHPRIKLLKAHAGRARQMNTGAKQADGEWLLFLHADTKLPRGGLAEIQQLSSEVLAGGFSHRFSGQAWGLRLVSWLHNFRCRRTHVFYGDQAMFFRKNFFWQLGGFPEKPILEDLLLSELVSKNTLPKMLDSFVVTDSRKFEKNGIWLSLLQVLLILASHQLKLPIPARGFFANVR